MFILIYMRILIPFYLTASKSPTELHKILIRKENSEPKNPLAFAAAACGGPERSAARAQNLQERAQGVELGDRDL